MTCVQELSSHHPSRLRKADREASLRPLRNAFRQTLGQVADCDFYSRYSFNSNMAVNFGGDPPQTVVGEHESPP